MVAIAASSCIFSPKGNKDRVGHNAYHTADRNSILAVSTRPARTKLPSITLNMDGRADDDNPKHVLPAITDRSVRSAEQPQDRS